MASSAPQARHLKWIIALMSSVMVMFLLIVAVQTAAAQSVADIARQERDRSKVSASRVITSVQPTKAEEPKTSPSPAGEQVKPAAVSQTSLKADAGKPQPPKAVDPAQAWNDQVNQLRTKIGKLQDEETGLILQLSRANNEVYAPVTDPATQQRAVTQAGQIQQQLDALRKDLVGARDSLNLLELQAPPKK